MWVYNDKLQIKFTFHSGPMIFGWVMALGLWNLAKYLGVTNFFAMLGDIDLIFIRSSRDGPYYVIGYGGRAGVHTGFRTINLVLYIGSLPNLATWFPCGSGRTLFILGSLCQRSRSLLLYIEFLTTGSFPLDNFSSVYWIFTKLDHIIPLWKGKNPIYFGVIIIIPFDNLYRRAYFVMHTFLVKYIIYIQLIH
jgi:hypothetical protein